MNAETFRSPLGVVRTLNRAVWLRCPLCGAPWRRTRWVTLSPRCESCGLRVDRGESDYFLGSYTINLFWSLMAAVGIAVAAALLPGWSLLIYGLVLPVLTALTIWLYPVSRLMWLAVDLLLRPMRPGDFEPNRP